MIHRSKHYSGIIKICEDLKANSRNQDINQVNAWLPHYESKALYRLGVNYKLLGVFHEALQYALQSIEYASHISPPEYEKARYYINAGDVYKEVKVFNKAIEFLRYGYDISRAIQHRENTRDAAEYLSQTYASLQQYDSAFYFYRIYTGLKDSIVNICKKTKSHNLAGLLKHAYSTGLIN